MSGSKAVTQAEIKTLLNIDTVLEKASKEKAKPDPSEQKKPTKADKPELDDSFIYEPQGLILQIRANFRSNWGQTTVKFSNG